MADKNIQIKQHNGSDWDNLYPRTKAEITVMSNGDTLEEKVQSMDQSIDDKADKSNTYTKQEVDNKVSESTTGIPVSPTEPDSAELWFEEI